MLSAAFAAAAPASKDKGDLYHPIKEGDKRVYEEKGVTGRVRESSNVVTKVEKKDDVFIVTTGREIKGKMRDTGTLEVSDKGVTTTATTFAKLKTPRPVIKLPAKEGDKWEYDSDGGDGPAGAKATFTVGKEEEIEVPAGKFKAIRIDAELKYDIGNGPTTIKTSRWYAPKVGLIKMVTNPGATESVMVLKSFTPGK